MNLKNIHDFPQWELQDVFTYAQSQLSDAEYESSKVKIIRYSEQTEDEKTYLEVYESEFYLDAEDDFKEFFDKVMNNEKLKKEFKQKKAFLQACINSHKAKNEFEYVMHEVI